MVGTQKMSATTAAGMGKTKLSKGARFIPSILTRVSRTIEVWIERSRQRYALGELAGDDHLLADIGLSSEQAHREARKLFWIFSKGGTPNRHPSLSQELVMRQCQYRAPQAMECKAARSSGRKIARVSCLKLR
jgi:uncharacterized protein YjiS (DUF1127 family)